MYTLILGLLIHLSAASASNSTELAAEHVRLSGELRMLASRHVWSGVERTFTKLHDLGMQPTVRDYIAGADAAFALGDVGAGYQRLRAAARINATREVVDRLWEIDKRFGRVHLTSNRRRIELSIQEMPMDPLARGAVERAIELVTETGVFRGALPAAQYSFGGHMFVVTAGTKIEITTEPRKNR